MTQPIDRDDVSKLTTAGPYDIVRRIGGGGMGMVFEAVDRTTGKRVALKTGRTPERSLMTDLHRQFQAVKSVQHSNLVRLGELFQDGTRWFLSMELVRGQDLMSWLTLMPDHQPFEGLSQDTTPNLGEALSDVGPLPCALADMERLKVALTQLADGLSALHEAGLVHRDVKPSNVLVTDAGHVVLVDFGLTCPAGGEDAEQHFVGTPAYMAPEQVGGGLMPAADCYALGVIMYQALTGRLPFVGPVPDVLAQKRAWSPVRPSVLAPGTPADLEALCLALLSRDPASRPTAAEISRFLRCRTQGRQQLPVDVGTMEVGGLIEDGLDVLFRLARRRLLVLAVYNAEWLTWSWIRVAASDS